MVERGRGTILFTGCSASLGGMSGFSELCMCNSLLIFKGVICRKKCVKLSINTYFVLKKVVGSLR